MSELIIIDPVKVVELQGQILAQLGKLVNASMKHWKTVPDEVKVELGNACVLMNKLVKEPESEQHKTESSNLQGGDNRGAPAGTGGSGGGSAPAVVKANPPGIAAQRSSRVRKSRRLTG